jgi:hypothetical protein
MANKKRNAPEKSESIFDMEHRLRQEAKQLSLLHKNKKVTKYDIK